MTEIWKDGAFAEDNWIVVADDEAVPTDKPAIVGLERWRSERDQLSTRNAAIGLLLQPDANWDDITEELSRFPVIAIAFPQYADGRGFSIARLLRDRDGYQGEVRAVGGYFVDQMPYLRRVGFDAFAISDPQVKASLDKGVWPEVPYYLQPVEDGVEVPAGTRPWARRPSR